MFALIARRIEVLDRSNHDEVNQSISPLARATFGTDEDGAPRAGAQGRGPGGPRRVATRDVQRRQGHDRQGQPGHRRTHGTLQAQGESELSSDDDAVSYTHLRAHET